MRLKPKPIRTDPPVMKWVDGPPTREGHYVLEWMDGESPVWTFLFVTSQELTISGLHTSDGYVELGKIVKHLEIIEDEN